MAKTIDQLREDRELGDQRRRDYFAAHAPPVPEWFEPKLPARPVRPEPESEAVFAAQLVYAGNSRSWPADRAGVGRTIGTEGVWHWQFPLTPELKAAAEQYDAELAACIRATQEWTEQKARETLLQWPWWYADQVLRRA